MRALSFSILSLALFMVAAEAASQSLAEVAKKEKERREQLEEPSAVIDGDALVRAGRGAPTTASTVTTKAPVDDPDATPTVESGAGPTPETGTSLSADGRDACRVELEALRQRKVTAQAKLDQGFSFQESTPRVRRPIRGLVTGRTDDGRPIKTDIESRESGFYYQTISMTCGEIANARAKYPKLHSQCKSLEQEVNQLDKQIARQQVTCEKAGRD